MPMKSPKLLLWAAAAGVFALGFATDQVRTARVRPESGSADERTLPARIAPPPVLPPERLQHFDNKRPRAIQRAMDTHRRARRAQKTGRAGGGYRLAPSWRLPGRGFAPAPRAAWLLTGLEP